LKSPFLSYDLKQLIKSYLSGPVKYFSCSAEKEYSAVFMTESIILFYFLKDMIFD